VHTRHHSVLHRHPAEGVEVNKSTGQVEPIFVSVKDAAKILGLAPITVYKLLNDGVIDSRYQGRRRSVVLTSLHDYAAGLPRKSA
jgi:hypothetical protein